MSKRFFIFVIDDQSNSGTREEMIAIDSFNEKLVAGGHLLALGGLADPSEANVIDNRKGAGLETGESLFSAAEHYSGFWFIQAENHEIAKKLAFAGSEACNRKVELRPLLG